MPGNPLKTAKFSPVQYLLGSALFVTLALYIYSLMGRIIHVDDGILAEPAYWLTQFGHLRSEALRGWQHAEEQFLFSHKLFLYIGAAFIKVFGWSIYSVKSVSLCYLVGLFIIWRQIFKMHQLPASVYWLFILLMITYGQIYELSFVFRPEVGIAFYASCIYYTITQYLRHTSWMFLILSGVLSALAIGHHLNSVIIPGGICVLLLANKKVFPMLVYGALASLGFLFFLLGVNNMQDWQLMVQQFKYSQDISSEHFTYWRYFFNIVNEHKRYLHSPSEIGFTLLLLGTTIANRKSLWPKYKSLIIFVLAAALFLALIAHGKTSKYLTILVPLYLFLISVSLKELFLKNRKTALALVALFFVGQWHHNYKFTLQKDYYTPTLQELSSKIEPGKNILGPIYGVFWAVPEHRYQAFMSYQWLWAHKLFSFTPEDLKAALDTHSIDYVIFNEEFWVRFGMTENALSGFTLIEKGPHHLYLFERTK